MCWRSRNPNLITQTTVTFAPVLGQQQLTDTCALQGRTLAKANQKHAYIVKCPTSANVGVLAVPSPQWKFFTVESA
jgi:hypothetical protein